MGAGYDTRFLAVLYNFFVLLFRIVEKCEKEIFFSFDAAENFVRFNIMDPLGGVMIIYMGKAEIVEG